MLNREWVSSLFVDDTAFFEFITSDYKIMSAVGAGVGNCVRNEYDLERDTRLLQWCGIAYLNDTDYFENRNLRRTYMDILGKKCLRMIADQIARNGSCHIYTCSGILPHIDHAMKSAPLPPYQMKLVSRCEFVEVNRKEKQWRANDIKQIVGDKASEVLASHIDSRKLEFLRKNEIYDIRAQCVCSLEEDGMMQMPMAIVVKQHQPAGKAKY
jgi:hypothetical protein